MNKLTLCLPTNNPAVYFEQFGKSIQNMVEISKVSTIAINFQAPWEEEAARKEVDRLKQIGFNVAHTFNKYDTTNGIPFNKIRNDAATLAKADYYALIDDDMFFRGAFRDRVTSGKQYLNCINYLDKYIKCGGVMMRDIDQLNCTIKPCDVGEWYTTSKGMLLRSMQDFKLFPTGALSLNGAGEEKVLAASRLNNGYYFAKIENARCMHDDRDAYQAGQLKYRWSSEEILEANINKFIRDEYGLPKLKGVLNYDIVNPKLYADNGGVPLIELKNGSYSCDCKEVKV